MLPKSCKGLQTTRPNHIDSARIIQRREMQYLETRQEGFDWGRNEVPFSQEAVLGAIVDPSSRKIWTATVAKGKTVEEISKETGIPLSTCYRKVGELVRDLVLVVERMVMTPTGKKYAIYRSAVEGAHVDIGPESMAFSVKENAAVAEKLRAIQLARRLSLLST